LRQTDEDDTIIDMFKKKPVLQYESAVETYPDIITPAKKHIPDWYKKIPKFFDNEFFTVGEGFKKTVKNCMPILDSFLTGYMVVLPQDLYITNKDGNPYISWQFAKFPPVWRDKVAHANLIPFGHYPTEYVWNFGVANTIPIGYSLLVTHPLNRHDLPFTTLTGIIDGGFLMPPTGNIPFYVKKDFEGIIPQGTPIAQLIPFAQENWKSKKTKDLVKKSNNQVDKSRSIMLGWYKKTFWTQKKYE